MGFETPSDGSITYDGIDLQAWNLRALRKQFGVVLQDTAVMTGMISDNIAGISHADIEDIREAARKAAILDDIEAMPMKFNTLISSESENISGGQKQRILLARAILPNPRIMFLDEATSALDNISQKKVLESLNEMKVTRMVIAHRLSTVRECDRIFVMDKGQIAEQGSYSELMEKGGLFKKLVERDMA
jgi:ABC-type bacteriocin/lantibiotic exporter with double-glycine peptidase domain